jgi:hypothetical protein
MGESVPKPVDQVANPICIDPGTMSLHRTPKPGAVCGSYHPHSTTRRPITVDTLIFDEDQMTSFFRSVSRAKSMERHVQIRWKDYDESKVLNFMYAVMPWKGKPGTLEVDLGAEEVIHREEAEGTEHLWTAFLEKSARGPAVLTEYLRAEERARARCLETVASALEEVRTLTNEIIQETKRGIFKLAVIKASATITVKTIGALRGGAPLFAQNSFLGKAFLTPGFLIGTGYDLSLNLIDNWDKTTEGKVVGVSSKLEEKAGKKVLTTVLKNAAETYSPSGKATHQLGWLPKRLQEMEQRLLKETDGELARKFARDSRRLARAQAEVASSRRIAGALNSVKFFFLAKDWYKAVLDAAGTVNSAGGTGYDWLDKRLGY